MIAVDTGSGLPALVTPAGPPAAGPDALAAWAEQHPDVLAGWTSTVGAVLFRGFEVTDAQQFRRVAAALLPDLRAYVGGDAPRTAVTERVYDATSSPPSEDLELHNELSYSGWWPTLLAFCCVTPAPEGGQTTIADGRQVYARLPDDVREPFARLGVTYHQHLRDRATDGDGKSWQDTFQETSRERVEDFCRAHGMTWRWTGLGLRTTRTNPGVLPGAAPDDTPRWFNQAASMHADLYLRDRSHRPGSFDIETSLGAHAQYGDGSEIPLDALHEVRRVYRSCEIPVQWQAGDVLVVDNRSVMHGRRAFRGERKVLLAMG